MLICRRSFFAAILQSPNFSMFPVILVLSHTSTNTRKKPQICLTDFWSRQNNLFEFCSHLTAGVQEDSVENKNLYLFTTVLITLPVKDTYHILLKIHYQTNRPQASLKLQSLLFATQPAGLTEKGQLFTAHPGVETKGSARGHLLQSILPACNLHTHMNKTS